MVKIHYLGANMLLLPVAMLYVLFSSLSVLDVKHDSLMIKLQQVLYCYVSFTISVWTSMSVWGAECIQGGIYD